MSGFPIEVWQDGHGGIWELVSFGLDGELGACLVREPLSRTDVRDGDLREGAQVIARFGDLEAARAFLWSEGFEPRT